METTHVLLVPVYQETEFVPKQMAVYRLHGIGAIFHTGTSGLDSGARFLYWKVKLYPVHTATGANYHQHDLLLFC